MRVISVFKALKKEKGTVVSALDRHLASLSAKDADRRIDVNAPSAAGQCVRARWFARTAPPGAGGTIDARTRRIFDNGTHVHMRLQQYMKDAGILKMDEVPVYNAEHCIQGHTDGIVCLNGEHAVVEIKSINSGGFSALIDAKEEHKRQGLVYLYCIEARRLEIRRLVAESGMGAWKLRKASRRKEAAKLYGHVADGAKYTREEKVAYQVSLHESLDSLLLGIEKPLERVVFLYENKDTQDIKEFSVYSGTPEARGIIESVLEECDFLNAAVRDGELPARPKGASCRFCDWKIDCETAGAGGRGLKN
jgi:CRISPR/Cas system-associated exonuclease Cas4 (RecB family)